MAPVCRLRLFRAIEPALPAVRLQPQLLLLLCALCGSGCGGRQFVRCRGLFGRFGGRDYGSFDRVQALVDPDGSRRRWRFSGCRVAALRSGRWCRGPDGCTQRAAAPAGECRSRGAAGRSARLRHRTIEIDRARNFAPYFVYSIFANCFFHRSPTGWFGSMHRRCTPDCFYRSMVVSLAGSAVHCLLWVHVRNRPASATPKKPLRSSFSG